MRVASIVIALAACGSSPKSTAPAQPAAGMSQEARTETPVSAGSATASGQLPSDVSAPPPPRAEAIDSAPTGVSETAQTGSTGPAAGNNPGTPRGTLIGQAWYRGPVCGDSAWPPRCNGPYRRTQVAIWSHATATWLRNSVTDDQGRYRFDVDPGVYTITLVTGYDRSPYWFAKVTVPPLETLTQNLVVDFGVR